MKDATTAPPAPDAAATPALGPIALAHDELTPAEASSLPRDHPAWQRDLISISARTRALLATLRPIAVRAKSFWDHAIRAVTIGTRRLEVDPSGSYRLR
ncbi:MAG TPA: hypothetical protein VHT53_00330 [Candidatus Elarobacter sp.]|jgi:hypothetical protein|nr:hypothetical protein [Candidatus Elarobacter sp.]